MLGVLDLAVQLAVAEQAGAAFAELHVRRRVQHLLAPQAPGVLGALAYRPAAFEHDRPEAHLRQRQPRQQPARARAHHDRPQTGPARGRRRDELVVGVRARPHIMVIGKLRQHLGLARHVHIDRIDQQDRTLLARVIAPPHDVKAAQRLGRDAQPRADGRRHRIVRMVERKGETGKTDHAARPTADCRAGQPPHQHHPLTLATGHPIFRSWTSSISPKPNGASA